MPLQHDTKFDPFAPSPLTAHYSTTNNNNNENTSGHAEFTHLESAHENPPNQAQPQLYHPPVSQHNNNNPHIVHNQPYEPYVANQQYNSHQTHLQQNYVHPQSNSRVAVDDAFLGSDDSIALILLITGFFFGSIFMWGACFVLYKRSKSQLAKRCALVSGVLVIGSILFHVGSFVLVFFISFVYSAVNKK